MLERVRSQQVSDFFERQLIWTTEQPQQIHEVDEECGFTILDRSRLHREKDDLKLNFVLWSSEFSCWFSFVCCCDCDFERAELLELAGKRAAACVFGLCSATEHGRQCSFLPSFLQLGGLFFVWLVGLLSLALFIAFEILRPSWVRPDGCLFTFLSAWFFRCFFNKADSFLQKY